MFKLEFQDGPFKGRGFTLKSGSIAIGRGPNCHIILPDNNLSLKHLTVRVEDQNALMRPESERSPVLVNGEQVIEEQAIAIGDIVSFGENSFTVRPLYEPLDFGGKRGEFSQFFLYLIIFCVFLFEGGFLAWMFLWTKQPPTETIAQIEERRHNDENFPAELEALAQRAEHQEKASINVILPGGGPTEEPEEEVDAVKETETEAEVAEETAVLIEEPAKDMVEETEEQDDNIPSELRLLSARARKQREERERLLAMLDAEEAAAAASKAVVVSAPIDDLPDTPQREPEPPTDEAAEAAKTAEATNTADSTVAEIKPAEEISKTVEQPAEVPAATKPKEVTVPKPEKTELVEPEVAEPKVAEPKVAEPKVAEPKVAEQNEKPAAKPVAPPKRAHSFKMPATKDNAKAEKILIAAKRLVDKGDLEKADRVMARLEGVRPNYYPVYISRAALYRERQLLDEAEHTLARLSVIAIGTPWADLADEQLIALEKLRAAESFNDTTETSAYSIVGNIEVVTIQSSSTNAIPPAKTPAVINNRPPEEAPAATVNMLPVEAPKEVPATTNNNAQATATQTPAADHAVQWGSSLPEEKSLREKEFKEIATDERVIKALEKKTKTDQPEETPEANQLISF